MKAKLIYLVVLFIFWVPCSGSSAGGGDDYSDVQMAGVRTRTVSIAVPVSRLRDSNITHEIRSSTGPGSEAEPQHVGAATTCSPGDIPELKQSSDEHVSRSVSNQARGTVKVALMIITLMVAVVVFMANIGD